MQPYRESSDPLSSGSTKGSLSGSIESFCSMSTRGYVGTYYKMSVKHLLRYLSEFAGLSQHRELETLDQMAFIGRTFERRFAVAR